MAYSTLQRRALWIALAPIALLQLVVAAHQFEHVADNVEKICHVCVQLDRIDTSVDHSADYTAKRLTGLLKLEATAVLFGRDFVRNFDSRAPPVL